VNQTQAIKANCIDCIYDPEAGGTATQQVENCTIKICNLWAFRPLTKATKANLLKDRIASMSEEERIKFRAKQDLAKARLNK
jgi:hypothetical protein